MKFPKKGLYAITQAEGKSIAALISEVEAALKGGAKVIQYRDKQAIDAEQSAALLLSLCHDYQAPLIINDDIQLAKTIGADGVHLGRDDGDILQARKQLGNQAIIGVSCYNDLAKALQMQKQGADYIAFGRFFPSTSKPLASAAELSTLINAKQSIDIPIVAIGGITVENGHQLIDAGADLLAVIGGIFNQADIEQATAAFSPLFKQ